MEPNNPNMNTGNGNSFGPVVGLIIILVVIVLGGLYFWGQRTGTYGHSGDESISEIEEQSSSDSISSIETDLEGTNTTDLDAELNAS